MQPQIAAYCFEADADWLRKKIPATCLGSAYCAVLA